MGYLAATGAYLIVAPAACRSFVVCQNKLPFGKLTVRHGLQLLYRCGGDLLHILVYVGHGKKDIPVISRLLPVSVHKYNSVLSHIQRPPESDRLVPWKNASEILLYVVGNLPLFHPIFVQRIGVDDVVKK